MTACYRLALGVIALLSSLCVARVQAFVAQGVGTQGSRSRSYQRAPTEVAATSHDVTFVHDGKETVVAVEEGTWFLDAMEGAGLDAPHSCRSGLCTECAAMVTSGADNVERDAAVLDPAVSAKGFILTCSASPKGPGIVMECGVGDRMYDEQYGSFRADHEAMQSKDKRPGSFPLPTQEAA